VDEQLAGLSVRGPEQQIAQLRRQIEAETRSVTQHVELLAREPRRAASLTPQIEAGQNSIRHYEARIAELSAAPTTLPASPYAPRFATQETMFGAPETTQLPPPAGRQMSMEESAGLAVQPGAPVDQPGLLQPEASVQAAPIAPTEAVPVAEMTAEQYQAEILDLRKQTAQLKDPVGQYADYLSRVEKGMAYGPERQAVTYRKEAAQDALTRPSQRTPKKPGYIVTQRYTTIGGQRIDTRISFPTVTRAIAVWDRLNAPGPDWTPKEWSRLSGGTIERYKSAMEEWGRERMLHELPSGSPTDEQLMLQELQGRRAANQEPGFAQAESENHVNDLKVELVNEQDLLAQKIKAAEDSAAEEGDWPPGALELAIQDAKDQHRDRIFDLKYEIQQSQGQADAEAPVEAPGNKRGGRVALAKMTLAQLQAEHKAQIGDKRALVRALHDMPYQMWPPALRDILEPMLKQELGDAYNPQGGVPLPPAAETAAPAASTPTQRAQDLSQRVAERQGPSPAFERRLREIAAQELQSEIRHLNWRLNQTNPERTAQGMADSLNAASPRAESRLRPTPRLTRRAAGTGCSISSTPCGFCLTGSNCSSGSAWADGTTRVRC